MANQKKIGESLCAWLQLFRLPNLPTAPGDALAGAAVGGLFVEGFDARRALAAGGAALALYMFGLVDNDLAGLDEDARTTPERPLPRGAISLPAARAARVLCLACALALGALFALPPAWWVCAAALVGAIMLYNRVKGAWAMGVCRGLSALCGAAAVVVFPPSRPALLALGALALGETLYIAAVTRLSEGEAQAREGLGAMRWALGLAAWTPCAACFVFPQPRLALLPVLGALWTFATWCVAVAPLGAPHDPARRRAAVGRTIGALLYVQIGFMLVTPQRAFLVTAFVLWLAARVIRRCAPSIQGS